MILRKLQIELSFWGNNADVATLQKICTLAANFLAIDS
jgi:hypothetical protein